MPQFAFRPQLDLKAVPKSIGPFLEIVGFQELQSRIAWMAERTRNNNYAQSVFFDRHALEFELHHIVTHFRKYGRLPVVNQAAGYISDEIRAYTFIWLLNKVYSLLNDKARKRLKGRIRLAFTDEEDLRSLEHELNVIAHLCRYGCKVTCHDLEGDGGYDFLAEREGLEFEVECKMISADKGHQIHLHDMLKLGEHFQRALDWQAYRSVEQGMLIRLTVAGRLPRNPELLRDIAEDCAQAALSGAPEPRADWSIDRAPFAIAGSPFASWNQDLSLDLMDEFLTQRCGGSSPHRLVFAERGRSALVVGVRSAKPDQVQDEVYLELKRAAKQLSGTRPGCLYVGMQNLTADDVMLLSVEAPGGLDAMVTRLFKNPSRQHLYGVTYLSEFEYHATTKRGVHTNGKVYRFINTGCPQAEERRLALGSDQLRD